MKRITLLAFAFLQTCTVALHAQAPDEKMVDVGGYALHVATSGSGAPAVIFEAGMGEDLSTWSKVQSAVAARTRVVTYDRAGLGKSEPSLQSRDARTMARELRTLLAKAGVAGPYVLVGHSLGGQIMRIFAHEYPQEVAGIVLVDPYPEEMEAELQQSIGPQAYAQRQLAIDTAFRDASPVQRLEKEALEQSSRQAAEAFPLPDVPTVLLTGTYANPAFPGSTVERDIKLRLHKEWIAHVPNARHIEVEGSRHYIQNDAPEVVIDAILDVLEQAEGRKVGVDARARKAVLDSKVEQWLETYDVPGIGVGFIEKGKIAWTAVYGEQSEGVRATDSTLYNIASLTKPVSAELVLRLIERGEVSLGESMSPYWIDPDLKDDPRHNRLTPFISLTHQTGFPNWRWNTDDDVLAFQFDPGTKYGYSGEGFDYMGRFIEKKLKKPFDELVEAYVFKPGNIEASFSRKDWFEGRIAVPYADGAYLKPSIQPAGRWTAADDLHITVEGYARFLQSVINCEGLSDELARQRESILVDVRNTVPPQVDSLLTASNVKAVGMSLGWMIFQFEDYKMLAHSGSDAGENALVLFDPAAKTGAVLLTNGANGTKIINRALGLLFDRKDLYNFYMSLEKARE